MNRTQIMDNFIKSIANIAQSDPILHISDRLVYHELLVRDLEKEEINKYFPYWIERFKNTPNIEVKNTENWKYFCRFENEESINDFFLQDAIKMYIPLKAEYIYEGANLLFDFMANENIVHSSKIGSKVRRDDIVIRVYSLKDAQKIQKFIIENEYIRSGLIMPNPFALNDNLIAYASDGLISYNSEVSRQISEYINELKNSNTLHTASLESFAEYVKKKQELYKTNEGIEELRSVYNDAKRITNCIEVVDLLNIALDGNANIIEFIEHYKSINNASTKMQKMNNVLNIMTQNTQYNIELFYNAILATAEKYGSQQAIEALMLYLTEGKANGFTSSFDARKNIRQLSQKSIAEICLKILGKPLNSKTEVIELVNNIIMSKSNTEELPIIQEINFTNYLEKSCYDSLMIYGVEQTIEAIKYAIEKKSYNGFTRTNNARQNLKDNIAIENINSIVMQTLINNGYDLICGYPDYITLYIEYLSKNFGLDAVPQKR